MDKFKKLLLVLGVLTLGTTAVATAQSDYQDTYEFSLEDGEEDFISEVDDLRLEVKFLENELNKYRNAPAKAGASAWTTTLEFGIEQELTANEDWRYNKRSHLISPFIGGFSQKRGSNWRYDYNFLKGYQSTRSQYNRTRGTFGVMYTNPMTIFTKPGSLGMRVAYRNELKAYKSMDATELASTYSNYQVGTENRHEYWIRPMLTINPTQKLSIFAGPTFRFIDQRIEWDMYGKNPNVAPGKNLGVETTDWSLIQEHMLQVKYSFNTRRNISLDYLWVREDLKQIILNEENFLIARYVHIFPNRTMVSPYYRQPLGDGKVKSRFATTGEREVERDRYRPRIGVTIAHPFGNGLSFRFDAYYRPEWEQVTKAPDQPNGGKKTDTNMFSWTTQLSYTF